MKYFPNNLKPGDLIRYRFYNTPENKYYGQVHIGKIVAVGVNADDKIFVITIEDNTGLQCMLDPKEYRGKVK